MQASNVSCGVGLQECVIVVSNSVVRPLTKAFRTHLCDAREQVLARKLPERDGAILKRDSCDQMEIVRANIWCKDVPGLPKSEGGEKWVNRFIKRVSQCCRRTNSECDAKQVKGKQRTDQHSESERRIFDFRFNL